MLPFSYALRNLWRRRGRTLLTLLGITTVTVLVVLLFGFAKGLSETTRKTASGRVLVLTGSGGEHDLVRSVIPRGKGETVAAKVPHVVEVGQLRAASPEIHIATRKGDMIGLLRGITPAAFLVHTQVTVVEGREPQSQRELLVGRLAETRMGLEPGSIRVGEMLELENMQWKVVGRFAAPGTVLEAEMWGRLDDVVDATQRADLSCVMLRFPDEDALERGRIWIFRNGSAYEVAAVSQAEIFATLQRALDPVASLAWVMAVMVLIGGILACANTMFAAVLARTREMGALRALGYGPFAIGMSLLQESVLLGLSGGVLGFWIADAFGEVPLKFPMGAFYLDMSPSIRLAGLCAALAAGIIGGIMPAIRAIRMPLKDALGGRL